MIEYDVETTGLQPYSGKNEAFLWIFYDGEVAEAIPFLPSEHNNTRPRPIECVENRLRIQRWFDRGAVEGIRAWNTKFDRAFAEQAGCFTLPGDGCWHDGMVVAHTIDERRSIALKAVAAQLFGEDAADEQKKLKAWLNAENSRRSKVLTDAEKARVGALRVKYVESKPCPACNGGDGGCDPGCPKCEGPGTIEKNRTRLATEDEREAIIAESLELTDAEGTYKRANYSDVPWEIIEPYALDDVFLTRKVSEVYGRLLEGAPDLQATVEFERKTMDALYAVEKRGLPARDGEYRKLEQEVIANLETLDNRVMELAAEGDPVIFARELAGRKNWAPDKTWVEMDETGKIRSYSGGAAMLSEFKANSTAQVIAALKARGADMSYMSEKDGKLSADADNLRAVDDELAVAILEFRSEYKVLSTYVRPMIGRSYVSAMNVYKEPFIAPDSRIHATYRQVGARTGRMSCSDPNMQNQPRDDLRLRYNIVADPGNVLVACDLSNIEMVLFAAYCGEGRLLDAVRKGEDLHVMTAKMLGLRDRKRPGGGVETARQLGKTYNFCRPLSVDILTQRGWLGHDGVEAGDFTLGYNPATRRNEWTEITEVHHFDDAPLVELSSGSWRTTSTPEHRWVTEKMRRPEIQRFRTTAELNSEDRIILAAPAEGWNHGIDDSTLLTLSGMRRDGEWEQRVIDMTNAERRAWLSGVALGEGCRSTGAWTIAQNEGPLYEAIKLALYMEGYRPSIGLQHHNGRVPCKWVRASKPSVTGQRLTKTDVGRGPVWCVTTELGSWTAREHGEIGLTGNSRIYGGGLRTIKRSFRCSMDEARLLKRRFDDAYPEVASLTTRITYRLADDGYIQDKLISGRRFRVAERDAYKATNYLVQGTAASVLKDALISLHADGVPVVALIHDEIVAHVPANEAEEAAKLIEKRMTQAAAPGGQLWLPEREGQRAGEKFVIPAGPIVPLRAEADIVKRWSDAKPLKDEHGPYLFTPEWDGGERRRVDWRGEALV